MQLRSTLGFFVVMCLVTTVQAQSSKVKAPKATRESASAVSEAETNQRLTSEIPALTQRQRMKNKSLSQNVLVPQAGEVAMNVSVQNIYSDQSYKFRGGSKDYTIRKGLMAKVRMDKGTQNGWGLSAEAGTPLGQVTESNKGFKEGDLKGLTDISFGARQILPQATGEIFYGGQFALSLGEKVWGTEFESGNLSSGGNVLSGFLGRQAQVNTTTVLGGRVRYDVMFERSESLKDGNSRVSLSRTGGNVFALEGFSERAVGKYLLGASAGLGLVQAQDLTVRLGSEKVEFTSDSHNTLNLGAYGLFQLKDVPGLEIMPSVSYNKPLSSSGGSLSLEDNSEMTQISVTGRWAL
jgi:hypothetical protein